MSIDLLTLARDAVQKLDRRFQTPPSQPKTRIAVQDDGDVISNDHRILNFVGPGVVVTDNPLSRRTDVLITGSPGSAVTVTTIPSTTAAKALPLWNGSSNDAPPANWYTSAFVDSGWSAAVVGTTTYISGATNIRPTTGGAGGEQSLYRQSFTLPAGTASSATLQIAADLILQDLYLNGTVVTGVTLPHTYPANPNQGVVAVSVPISQLVLGGTNVIAARVQNDTDGDRGQIAYLLTVNSSQTNASAVQHYVGSDVTMTTANTYYDGPTLTLGAGTWLLVGKITVIPTVAGSSTVTSKLWDGTNNLDSAQQVSGGTGFALEFSHVGLVSPTTSTTYKISAAGNANGGAIKAAATINAAGSTASHLVAARLA